MWHTIRYKKLNVKPLNLDKDEASIRCHFNFNTSIHNSPVNKQTNLARMLSTVAAIFNPTTGQLLDRCNQWLHDISENMFIFFCLPSNGSVQWSGDFIIISFGQVTGKLDCLMYGGLVVMMLALTNFYLKFQQHLSKTLF